MLKVLTPLPMLPHFFTPPQFITITPTPMRQSLTPPQLFAIHFRLTFNSSSQL